VPGASNAIAVMVIVNHRSAVLEMCQMFVMFGACGDYFLSAASIFFTYFSGSL
jgi:hypothetical protein